MSPRLAQCAFAKLLDLVDDIIALRKQVDTCLKPGEGTLRGGARWLENRRQIAKDSLQAIIDDCDVGLQLAPKNDYFRQKMNEAVEELNELMRT